MSGTTSSASTRAPGRSVRNTVLLTAGAVVILATYLYLILFQPTDIADGLGQSSFVAIAGYLIGAVLIVLGTIHRLPTTTIALLPVAIAVNIVIGQLTTVIGLPLYLDSIGTILVAALAGPAAGAATGALTNVIWGMTISPFALPFAVTAVVIGVLAGWLARIGVFRRFWLVPIAGLGTGIVAALVSAPIAAFLFGGTTAAGTGALVGAFRAMGASLLQATTAQGLLSDPVDKAVTFTVVALILAALPTRFRQRFPFVRTYRVFGRATVAATADAHGNAGAAPSHGATASDGATGSTTGTSAQG